MWNAPETITSSSEMPEEFVTAIKENTVETDGNTNYEDWLDGLHPLNEIVVNPRPEDVPRRLRCSEMTSLHALS